MLVWPNKDQFGIKSMAISLLSALLKRHGHQVRLFDTTYIDFGAADNTSIRNKAQVFKEVTDPKWDTSKVPKDLNQETRAILEDFVPDVVGISALLDEVDLGLIVSRTVKEWNPAAVVVWGNKSPTMEPERVMAHPQVDYLCRGEAVEFFPEFLACLERGEKPEDLANLVYRDREGRLRLNPVRPYFQELDSLPQLDWSIFDDRQFYRPFDGRIYRAGDHMIFWGCPNRCSYCINDSYRKLYGSEAGKFLRHYSVPRIVDELESLARDWNLEFFKFYDEDFCLKPVPYFQELAEAYAARVGLPFTCMVNAKQVTPKKVELLKRMNCVNVTIGIETGNEQLRREILQRYESKEDIIRAVGLLNDAGIRTSSFNMMGLPFENRERFMETVELNRAARVQYPNIGFFMPLPGTPLREIALSQGFWQPEAACEFVDGVPYLELPEFPQEEMKALFDRFVYYVKLPEEFLPFVQRSEKQDAVGRRLDALLHQIYGETVLSQGGWYRDQGRGEEYLARLRACLEEDQGQPAEITS